MDLYDAIRASRSCTTFQTRPVPEEKVRAVVAAARLAPSQSNLQPWRFVVVRGEELKRQIAQACPRGKIVAEAPVVIVAFALEDDLPMTVGGYISTYPLDTAVAVHQLRLAAVAEGLATNWIVDFHEDKIRRALQIPEGIHPIAVIPLGFPAETNGSAPSEGRKSPDEIIAYDRYPW
ncbi:MAG: nitroreductase family protein [Thermoplasmata archaeon]|nr:nitroreductase family protein [Thermoplasmata archaeon]